MPTFTRPSGILCSGEVYADKKNPYEKLKQFLYEENTGRTDVVFFASYASGYESNQWEWDSNGEEDYHYVGGLIDGFAKAVLQGNPSANRPARKLYGTPVKYAYESGVIPNFDPWNNSTWFNANPTGLGGYMTGCSTAYDDYFYARTLLATPTIANSVHGWIITSMPSPGSGTYYQDHPDTGPVSLPFNNLWYSAFRDGIEANSDSPPNNNASFTIKQNFAFANICLYVSQDSNKVNLNSTTLSWLNFVTTTPEQPQRFWDVDHPLIIPNPSTNYISIGIGYLDTTTNKVAEIFTDASNYGWVPAGVTTGTDLSVLISNPDVRVCRRDNFSFTIDTAISGNTNWGNPSNLIVNFHQNSLGLTYEDFRSFYENEFRQDTYKLIVRRKTFKDVILDAGLNISITKPTSETEWKSFDGFLNNGSWTTGGLVLRWTWANTDTGLSNDINSLNNKLFKKWGLATSSDSSVSTKQVGLPYIFMWGLRQSAPSNAAWNIMDFGIPQMLNSPEFPLGNDQLNGFPRCISTLAPNGFFCLTQEDTAKINNANITKFKDRCLKIRPDLGLFHNGFDITGQIPQTTNLNNTTKDNILGIFKSSTFKYCVTAYTLDKYSDETTFEGANVVITGHHKDKVGGSLTAIQGATNVVIPQTVRNKANGESRLTQRTLIETTFNLNAINNDWSRGELRFGFLGKGSATNTKGNLIITTHYGVDPTATNGISFTPVEMAYRYRSGDTAYLNKTFGKQSAKGSHYIELLRSIAERQTKASLGGTPGISKKLVIMIETGIWELANPNLSYNGKNTWQYFVDPKTGSYSTGVTGNTQFLFENNALTYFLNAAIIAGFTREEIVVAFYTPTYLTRTNVQSQGTIGSLTLNSAADEKNYINSLNERGNFIRAGEIFKNNILPSQGYFNPTANDYNTARPAAQKALYINMGSISPIVSKLGSIDASNKQFYYHMQKSNSTDFSCTTYGPYGSLAVGSLLADYLNTQVSTNLFIPGWIVPFSEMLGYITEPVLGIDLGLCVQTTERAEIEAYLNDYYNAIRGGNIQATEMLSAYKHKTLQ